ncbi:MAG: serine hydrolase, partial [Bradyrhizobium sp.]|nr:serine hydrolase [Bradyrhizobium sp.]
MTRTAGFLIALFASAPLATSALAQTRPFGPPGGARIAVGKLGAIGDFVNGEVAAGRIPGAIVLVQQHGRPLYLRCFGTRDPDRAAPMTEDAIFPIHSVTKTITSI